MGPPAPSPPSECVPLEPKRGVEGWGEPIRMVGEKTWHPVYSVCKVIAQHSFQEQGYTALCVSQWKVCIPVENVYPSGKCVSQWKVCIPVENVYPSGKCLSQWKV